MEVQVSREREKKSAAYWLTVGWLVALLKLCGRVFLWLVFWPLGLWRSIAHGRKKRREVLVVKVDPGHTAAGYDPKLERGRRGPSPRG